MTHRTRKVTSAGLSRRQLLVGTAAVGLAVTGGGAATTPASADEPQRTFSSIRYDQRAYRFAPVALLSRSTPVRWERRSSAGALWKSIAGGSNVLRFTPSWRDIGAEYRAVDSAGKVLQHVELACPDLVGVDPASFGAVGDGVTDDTNALNLATSAAAAQQTGVNLNGRTYLVSGRIKVTDGVSAVFGGTIRQSGTAASPLYLEGRAEGRATNVSGCVICDVTIELTALASAVGVVASSASHIAVINCTIGNPQCPGRGVLYSMAGGDQAGTDIVVRDNAITLLPDEGTGITVGGVSNLLGSPSALDYWKTYFRPADPLFPLTDVDVIGNQISGGYYGISLGAVWDFNIQANDSTMNIRNISIQGTSLRGTVETNSLSESVSSSIHLAYSSSDCVITGNTISTSRAYGEGLLQAYVGSKNNLFTGNHVTATSPDGPKWHIYTGVHANGNRFENNTLVGTCSRAYIAVEAAWDSTNAHPAHRATGLPSTDNFAADDIVDVQLIDNEIAPTSSVEYICLADITDANGTFHVVNPVLSGNHLQGSTTDIVPHQYLG